MKRTTLNVENLSCNGCANSIRRGLSKIEGIEIVKLDYARGNIELRFEHFSDLNAAKSKLEDLGYPDADRASIFHKGRSTVSCLLGKLTSENGQ